MLLPQDLYVLVKLCSLKNGWTFRMVADQLFLSQSQVYAGLKRAEIAGLYSDNRRQPNRRTLEEFIIHGVKYAYAVRPGPLIIGLPTSYAAAPLKTLLVRSTGPPPVWAFPEGKQMGYTIEPLHPAAPKAALLDDSFHQLLCLIDAIREGRARERQLAKEEIHKRLRN